MNLNINNHIKLIFLFALVVGSSIMLVDLHADPQITNYPSNGTDIIAFGDSLVQGVGTSAENNFVSILSKKIGEPIINLGVSGNTTYDGLARLDQLDEYNPKIVLLLLGGNDFLKKIPREQTFTNLSKIIENIQARGAVVILLGVRGGLMTDSYGSEFKKLSDKYHVAYVSDVLNTLLADTRYMSDAVHPNSVGYNIIAERIYPVLVRYMR